MTTTTLEPQPEVFDRPIHQALSLTWEKVLYVVLLVAAFITRFYDLGTRVMSHDESLHTQFGWYLWQGRGFQHSPLMHGVLRFEVTALSYWLFGDSDFTARMAPALMGVIAVGLMYFYRRYLGRTGALLAALLILISPFNLYYSRYIRDEPYMIVWALLIVYCTLRHLETSAPRYLYWLAAITALFYTTMEASFIYIAILMLFLGLHLVRELIATPWPRPSLRAPFAIAFGVTLVALAITMGLVLYVTRLRSYAELPPGMSEATVDQLQALSGIASLALVIGLAAGAGLAIASFGRDAIRRFPVFNVLMVLGVFVLPQLTAFPALALGKDPLNYTLPSVQGVPPGEMMRTVLLSDAAVTGMIALALFAVSVTLGLLWDARTFLICAGIFWGIFITLFTTFFTNGGGLATGVIGSLAYWLAQHDVKRGGQPLYYYAAITMPMYEFLPVLGAVFAGGLGLRRWLRLEPAAAQAEVDVAAPPVLAVEERPATFPIIGFLGVWAVLGLAAFSVAGEKMPWLTTHITLPFILLTGWAVGRFVDETDWARVRAQRGWLVAASLPVALLAVLATLGSLLGGNPPFQGSEMAQLQATGTFVSALIVSLIGIGALIYLGRPLGVDLMLRLGGMWVFVVLVLLTARAAVFAAYINYDYANEFLVYAHGARGVKTVMEQVDDIALRTEDGYTLKVAYDSDVAWPMTWYLRDYTSQAYYGDQPTREQLDAPVVISGPNHWSKVESLLGDRYYQFDYIRMVWPMQDYFNLTWERISGALRDPQMRQALWNIWYGRDYAAYGQITGGNFELSEWPVSEHMRLYVRKDIAARIWPYGVGPTALEAEAPPEDPYAAARQVLSAAAVWGAEGAGPGQFQAPRGVAAAPDGSVYVADSRNHRIQKFDSSGNFILAWGGFGSLDNNSATPGTFNEPWGVAVGSDGSVYVADTWNHRIQKFDGNGTFVKLWGRFGQAESLDALWGPRSVAIDGSGRVYVADTGNKRIVVFDADGNGVTAIGTGGTDPGQLDEPVGLAVTSDGIVYVADTWNQRMQVFYYEKEADDFLFLREWPVAAWYGQSLDNKPYVALDARQRVFVTDPEGYRVLVFDRDGNFITTWGDYGTDTTTVGLAMAPAVDAEGNIYVTDAGNQRVMKFAPIP